MRSLYCLNAPKKNVVVQPLITTPILAHLLIDLQIVKLPKRLKTILSDNWPIKEQRTVHTVQTQTPSNIM